MPNTHTHSLTHSSTVLPGKSFKLVSPFSVHLIILTKSSWCLTHTHTHTHTHTLLNWWTVSPWNNIILILLNYNNILFIFSFSFFFFIFFFFSHFLAAPRGLWDFSYPTRNWTWAMVVKEQSPNHWTTMDFPIFFFFNGTNTCVSYIIVVYLFFLIDYWLQRYYDCLVCICSSSLALYIVALLACLSTNGPLGGAKGL